MPQDLYDYSGTRSVPSERGGTFVDELRLPGSIGIIFVNSRHADLSSDLSDGDTVSIFPLVGGG